jgi:dihydrofolate reductase
VANRKGDHTIRKIVAGLFVSLDGVVESPEQWNAPYFNDEIGAVLGSQMAAADTMLLGRVTYEEFAAYWADKGSDVPFADAINGIPKLVASRTLTEVDWQNTTVINGDLVARLSELKQQAGKDIITSGSATLVGWLLRAGLLDELRLLVYPVVAGRGRRIFENGFEQMSLELADSRTLTNGVLSLTYVPSAN